MAVGLCGIVSEVFHHVQPDIFVLCKFRLLHQFKQFAGAFFPIGLYADIPGLMVQSGTDNIHILFVPAKSFGNLLMPVLYAVTKPVGFYLSVLVACPGYHGVGIGIIEENTARSSHFPDILAKIKQSVYAALPIHDAADAKGIAHALVNAVF